jgi:hypothetical protein
LAKWLLSTCYHRELGTLRVDLLLSGIEYSRLGRYSHNWLMSSLSRLLWELSTLRCLWKLPIRESSMLLGLLTWHHQKRCNEHQIRLEIVVLVVKRIADIWISLLLLLRHVHSLVRHLHWYHIGRIEVWHLGLRIVLLRWVGWHHSGRFLFRLGIWSFLS